jgi:hypothetical protein
MRLRCTPGILNCTLRCTPSCAHTWADIYFTWDSDVLLCLYILQHCNLYILGKAVDIIWVIFRRVNTFFETTAIFKYIPMLERETDRENNVNTTFHISWIWAHLAIMHSVWISNQSSRPHSASHYAWFSAYICSVNKIHSDEHSAASVRSICHCSIYLGPTFRVHNMANPFPDAPSAEIDRCYTGSAFWYVAVFMISCKTKFKWIFPSFEQVSSSNAFWTLSGHPKFRIHLPRFSPKFRLKSRTELRSHWRFTDFAEKLDETELW